MRKKLILLGALFLLWPSFCSATTLISEDFNDRAFSTTLKVMKSTSVDNPGTYCTGTSCNYATTPNYSGTGYSIWGDHRYAYDFIWFPAGSQSSTLTTRIEQGIYIRYYIYYSATYQSAAEAGYSIANIKMLKLANGSTGLGADIEVLWNSTSMPYTRLKFQYFDYTGTIHSLSAGASFAADSVAKGEWSKIEIYVRIPSGGSAQSEFRMQVNDIDSWNYTAPNYLSLRGGNDYLSSPSVRASGTVANTVSLWYGDDLTVVVGEGDLCDNEPPPIGVTPPADTTAPTMSNYVPASGATGISRSANVVFSAVDYGSGVNTSSFTSATTIKVGGVSKAGAWSTSAIEGGYTFTFNPTVDFTYSDVVAVVVNGQDNDTNAITPVSYSFTIEESPVDISPPTITNFTILSMSGTSSVPVTAFVASDNTAVTGYLITDSATTPSLYDPNWSATPQTDFFFSAEGSQTAYAWAKDAADNISSYSTAITDINTVPPILAESYTDTTGSLLQLVFASACQLGSGSGLWDFGTNVYGTHTLTYLSGSGSTTWQYKIIPPVRIDETILGGLNYALSETAEVETSYGVALDWIENFTLTNYSTLYKAASSRQYGSSCSGGSLN